MDGSIQVDEVAKIYILALVEADALDGEEIDLETSFRQSWHEAMTGQIHPIETLWDDLDDE